MRLKMELVFEHKNCIKNAYLLLYIPPLKYGHFSKNEHLLNSREIINVPWNKF